MKILVLLSLFIFLVSLHAVYAQDIFEGGHTEIHPVYKIEVIGGASSSSSDPITTTPSSY